MHTLLKQVLFVASITATCAFACDNTKNEVGLFYKDMKLTTALSMVAIQLKKEPKIDPSIEGQGKFVYACLPASQVLSDIESRFAVTITLTNTQLIASPK